MIKCGAFFLALVYEVYNFSIWTVTSGNLNNSTEHGVIITVYYIHSGTVTHGYYVPLSIKFKTKPGLLIKSAMIVSKN